MRLFYLFLGGKKFDNRCGVEIEPLQSRANLACENDITFRLDPDYFFFSKGWMRDHDFCEVGSGTCPLKNIMHS